MYSRLHLVAQLFLTRYAECRRYTRFPTSHKVERLESCGPDLPAAQNPPKLGHWRKEIRCIHLHEQANDEQEADILFEHHAQEGISPIQPSLSRNAKNSKSPGLNLR